LSARATSAPQIPRAAVQRLLEKARRDTWSIREVSLDGPVRPMSRADEEAVVQYLTDFIFIERMAGAFFEALRHKVDDPLVVELLGHFVEDETRHAQAMQLLADRFDVHHHRIYAANPHLVALTQRMAEWIRLAPPDAASAAVTVGEIVLDIAYLKPVDDFVDDPVARAVFRRIHRDESRHIALDYLLLDAYGAEDVDLPKPTLGQTIALSLAFTCALRAGVPFMREVFFGQSSHVDPDGRRLRDAVRRIQLLSQRGHLSSRGFGRIYGAVQRAFDSPIAGPWARRLMAALVNGDPEVFRSQFSADERAAHVRRSAEEAAHDTVAAFAGVLDDPHGHTEPGDRSA
jgi:rubrerythrin